MNVTSISLAYLFLGIGLISLSFFIYFKILTSNSSKKSEKIVGDMKDSKSWLNRNNKMAYVSLFWSIVSLCLFYLFKIFYYAYYNFFIICYWLYFLNSYISCSSWYKKTRKRCLKSKIN